MSNLTSSVYYFITPAHPCTLYTPTTLDNLRHCKADPRAPLKCAVHLYPSRSEILYQRLPSLATLKFDINLMSNTARQPRRWTQAEDQVLREQVDIQQAHGGSRDWCQIALALPGRTNKDCRKRWHNSVAEGLKKGQWSKSEDQLLTYGVHRHGFQWTKVATCVWSRSADQCAKRWQQSLDPRLDRSEWREAEDSALLAAVERLGRHWKDIQGQYLPHRSKNCVKNRYSVLARRNAVHSNPSDDGPESSSSDPDTPVNTSLTLNFTSTPLVSGITHPPHQQHQVPPNNNGELSWSWVGNGNQNVTFSGSQYDPFDVSSWSAFCGVFPLQTSPGSHNQWSGLQHGVDMQDPGFYPTTAVPAMNSHPRSMQHQACSSSTISCMTPMIQSLNPRVQTERLASLPAHRVGYGRTYRPG